MTLEFTSVLARLARKDHSDTSRPIAILPKVTCCVYRCKNSFHENVSLQRVKLQLNCEIKGMGIFILKILIFTAVVFNSPYRVCCRQSKLLGSFRRINVHISHLALMNTRRPSRLQRSLTNELASLVLHRINLVEIHVAP